LTGLFGNFVSSFFQHVPVDIANVFDGNVRTRGEGFENGKTSAVNTHGCNGDFVIGGRFGSGSLEQAEACCGDS
jgi:hypothetical protein